MRKMQTAVLSLSVVLAACAAQCVPGSKLSWDTRTQRFDNDAANAMIKPYIRSGWEF